MKRLVNKFLGLFGEGFGDPKLSIRRRFLHVIVQKVLRFNGHVSWPVSWTSEIKGVEHIKRGTRFPGLATNVYIDGRNGIVLGDNVWIGPRASLISMNHDVTNYFEYVSTDPIVIGNNCWIGANAIILPGVRLGNHVIVAAGAVVTCSFEEDDILLGGVPASVIKFLPPYQSTTVNQERNTRT